MHMMGACSIICKRHRTSIITLGSDSIAAILTAAVVAMCSLVIPEARDLVVAAAHNFESCGLPLPVSLSLPGR